ncbi:MAG: hypothetical protein KDD48_07105, partial [Bdellovibrionales bacterium]|nr:hypothetical protein [Bdellovibrionales bacterium]
MKQNFILKMLALIALIMNISNGHAQEGSAIPDIDFSLIHQRLFGLYPHERGRYFDRNERLYYHRDKTAYYVPGRPYDHIYTFDWACKKIADDPRDYSEIASDLVDNLENTVDTDTSETSASSFSLLCYETTAGVQPSDLTSFKVQVFSTGLNHVGSLSENFQTYAMSCGAVVFETAENLMDNILSSERYADGINKENLRAFLLEELIPDLVIDGVGQRDSGWSGPDTTYFEFYESKRLNPEEPFENYLDDPRFDLPCLLVGLDEKHGSSLKTLYE